MSYSNQELISQLYIVYCGRPADPEGLDFWSQKLATEENKKTVLKQFETLADSQVESIVDNLVESGNGVDKSDILKLVNILTARALSRSPTVREQAYFVAVAKRNMLSAIELATFFIDSLQGGDKDSFDKRLKRAMEFTEMVKTTGRPYRKEHIPEAQHFMLQNDS